jgi:beta-lactam-binding protein with PASTA domain
MSGNSFADVDPLASLRASAVGIFLSYRRRDRDAQVDRLYDRLINRFGERRVFRDVDRTEPGTNFVVKIDRALSTSRVLIAVIGPTWETVTNSQGKRRLDDPKDYVRYEIARALEKHDCTVLPVLWGVGTLMPEAEALPDELRPLATIDAYRIDDDPERQHFEFDAQKVVKAVAYILGEPESPVGPNIVLTPPDLILEPGHSGQITIAARNVGTISTDLTLAYDGPNWARLSPAIESRAGGRELRNSLTVSPPRRADLPARAWPYSIELRDQAARTSVARASGSLTTEAFRDTQVHLEPARIETRRSSSLSLMVRNGGNVQLHGRVVTKAQRLSLEGPDRITLGPGAKETYQVSVRAPARRLVGRAIEHPVTVSVAVQGERERHVRQATIRQRPLLPAGVAMVTATILAVLLGLGIWTALEAEARFPDVIAQSEGEALAELKEAGWEQEQIDITYVPAEADQAAGQVVRTSPEHDTEYPLDKSVTIYVTEEPTLKKLPNVTNMTQSEAEKALDEAGFTNVDSTSEEATEEKPGEVLRTDPEPGSDVPLDQAIVIYVATAPKTDGDTETDTDSDRQTLYTITDVRGMTWEEAVENLPRPLEIVRASEESDVEEGTVIRTEPEIGTRHPAGTDVTVFISTGQSPPSELVTVPSVVGLDAVAAESTLQAAGLALSTQPQDSCENPEGLVIQQFPDPGAEVEFGSTVTITVAQPPPDGCGG